MANNEREEKDPQQPVPPPAEGVGFDISSLPSARKEGTRRVTHGGNLFPEIRPLPGSASPILIENGNIVIDKDRMLAEYERTREWLRNGVVAGDTKVLEVYLRNIVGDTDEEDELREALKSAFEAKDPNLLRFDALHINEPTAGIAQRNLMREGLRPELDRQPFTFLDRDEQVLPFDDLDFVFARNERKPDEFKIIVGSKKGIDSFVLPQGDLERNKFVPDLLKMEKDDDNGAIIVPLKSAKDGIQPSAPLIEIRKGPIDVMEELAKEERMMGSHRPDDDWGSTAGRPTTPPSFPGPSSAPYNPPAPRQQTRRSSESYGYTRVSG